MKWIGQNIQHFISRFNQKVYLENADIEMRKVSGQPTLELSAWSATATAAHAGRIKFLKSGTATFDTYTAGNHTTAGEVLGRIEAYGIDDGDGETLSSYIEFANDAISDADSSPGKIVFATSDADDAGTPTVRLTIDDDGLAAFTGSISAVGSATLPQILSCTDFELDSVRITAVQTSAESFVDNDTSIMTSAAIADKIEAYGYSTTAGDITGVTAGTNLTGGGSSGTVTLNLADASTSAKGAASFTSGDFTASSGAISLADTVIKTLGSDSGSTLPEGHEVVIAGGNGIDTSGADAIITITAETASDTNPGVVELATTAEADTGTDTARAITAAGLESHVSARYSYQYVHFIGNSDLANWGIPTANGAFANNWSSDTGENGTTVNSTNVDLGRGYSTIGFTVPVASVLVGFNATMRNHNNSNQGALGLFHTAGSNVWGTTGTANYKLQAYATQGYSGGAGSNYKGGCYVTDVSRSLALAAGDIIIPAALETTADKVYFQMTMILKTLIPT